MNDYEVLNYLAKGKFGNVQLATRDGEFYALKVISREHYNREEVFILKRLVGVPGVVQYIEHFFTGDDAVIVTEYCPGEELFEKISLDGEFSEPYAIEIFKQLCGIVKDIHARGIVHRDLKLENIIIKEDKLTLLDFGLAFYPEDTRERVCCGSTYYASPELVCDDMTYEGVEVDVWALGVILYTFLTASLPFRGETTKDIYNEICKCSPEYFEEEFSREVVNLLKRIFVKENRITLDEIIQYLNEKF